MGDTSGYEASIPGANGEKRRIGSERREASMRHEAGSWRPKHGWKVVA